MDPRLFANNITASSQPQQRPYSYPSAPAPAPSPASHQSQPQPYDIRGPPSAPYTPYAPHQRRPSDSSHPPSAATHTYYDQPPTYTRAQPLSSTREQEVGNMPPPNSPPQQGPPHHSQHHPQQPQNPMQGYSSGPPPPRPPPLGVGPPASFAGGRELPALSSITRQGPGGSSMSISSLLGGPAREAHSQHPYQQHSTAPPGIGPGFAPPGHASPRMQSASADYSPFRRPQTPDHQRPYDPRGSAAPSPRGPYGTPDVPRYGTPQTYHARHMSASADPSRDLSRMSSGPAPPPRPSSQPKAYPGGPPRPAQGPDDRYGRAAPGPEYNPERVGLRPNPYEDRYRAERERHAELEQREHERREYERRERAYSGSDSGRHSMHPHEMGHREPQQHQQQQPSYGHPEGRDPRDAHWGRPASDPNFRAPMDHQRQHSEYPPHSTAPPYQAPPYQTSPERYPPKSLPPHSQGHSAGQPQPYESPERARMGLPHSQHQQQPAPQMPGQRVRPGEELSAGPPSIAFTPGQGEPPFDGLRHRNSDDASAPLGHQRNLLAIQLENRKGRISPLPQAVQGVQPQQPGPGTEPGIKSEFGRMFSGIGSGVGALGLSPTTSAAGPFTNAALAKREDGEGPDSGPDVTGKATKGRRRKLKEEESRDDDSGRATPGQKVKRAKGQHHHHQHADEHGVKGAAHRHNHHHHHHHRLPGEAAPGNSPFRNAKGSATGDSPTDKTLVGHHHHHHHVPRGQGQGQAARQAVQPTVPQIPPRTKTIVSSQSVLDAAARFKRHHLGDFIYEPELKPQRLVPNPRLLRGFASNPKPLPWDIIKDKINCILTVKVPWIHLSPTAREEITSRHYLWGTDIYTDDSDVVAACIHGGWIKGEWNETVEMSMLDIDNTEKRRKKEIPNDVDQQSEQLITKPPATGPMAIPAERDLHVNVLILPKLARYGATTRFGIASRDFGGEFGSRHVTHDGLSFKVHSIRWVENGAQPQARLRGKARRERMRKAMQEVRTTVTNLNGLETDSEKERLGEIKGSWWKQEKQTEKDEVERPSSEGDKENRSAEDKADKANGEETQPKDVEMGDAPKEVVAE